MQPSSKAAAALQDSCLNEGDMVILSIEGLPADIQRSSLYMQSTGNWKTFISQAIAAICVIYQGSSVKAALRIMWTSVDLLL